MSVEFNRIPTLRIARPTDKLGALTRLYLEGLELSILGSFQDHDGFDGVMLGHPTSPYHLEFTSERKKQAGGAPSDEHLLVFYIADTHEWATRCDKMVGAGFKPVRAANPYWDKAGRAFEDLDGYRVVIQNSVWPPT